jgi:hypothetical protein
MPEFPGTLKPPRAATAPASPVQGQLFFNTATSKLQWWSGTVWVDATGSGGGGAQIPTTYSVTAGYTKDRAFNTTATTLNEVATVLGTLIDDMKAAGMIAP